MAGRLTIRCFTMMLIVIIFAVWTTSLFESCDARRGGHWRHRGVSMSLSSKKKTKSHNNGHGSNYHHSGGKSKPKPAKSPPKKAPKVPPPQKKGGSATYNVLHYGAKGDGRTDDTKAFQDTWAEVCKVAASTMIIPSDYVFLVGPISFAGPNCQHNIVFQLDGKIIAPTSSKAWGKGLLQWLEFTKLIGITIRGNGVIDGSGSVWWQSTIYDDLVADSEEKLIVPLNKTLVHPPVPVSTDLIVKMPSIKPTALRFYGSFNVTVSGITIQNSPQCHLKFDNCMGVSVYLVTVNSPGDSPNTDGIHLQNSRQVLIHSVNLACGDDCISIQTGCSNVYVHNVNCGPGHGISIGSLGKDNTKACVSNITCVDVSLTSIQLKPVQERYHMYDPFCWHAYGQLNTPTLPPIDCLQLGKPSSNRIQSDHDVC